MTIQPINEFDVALFIGRKDLEKRGLSPEVLSIREAKKMAREAFVEAGIEVEGGMEIEAFTAESGVLVFARRIPPQPAIFVFSDFETLIDAVEALGEPGETASITYLDGWWYISITAASHRSHLLSEFGDRLECAPSFSEHLREYGQTVLHEGRTGMLRAYFM
ncbi:MAG: adaptor protein MecA [Clostridiales bacterium]|nr:adaptor protein MecA [Clostridiales bacterium]